MITSSRRDLFALHQAGCLPAAADGLGRLETLKRRSTLLECLCGAAWLLCAGCTAPAVVGTDGSGVAQAGDGDFRSYAEAVFRLQNAMLDELIVSADAGATHSTSAVAALSTAEERLVDHCRHLNEAASISAVGGEPGLPLKLRVMNSVAECEAAALDVRTLLHASTAVLSAAGP